jgi:hypothetical protein
MVRLGRWQGARIPKKPDSAVFTVDSLSRGDVSENHSAVIELQSLTHETNG